MELIHELPREFTRDYTKMRKNITLVIEYLEKLKDKPPSIEVNNDSVRLLMESLTSANEMYQDLNKLPAYNMELRHQNHYLSVENKRLKNEIIKLNK